MDSPIAGLMGAALLAVFVFAMLDSGRDDEQAAQDHYCEMVEIWDQTDGEYGWPPYEGREPCQ